MDKLSLCLGLVAIVIVCAAGGYYALSGSEGGSDTPYNSGSEHTQNNDSTEKIGSPAITGKCGKNLSWSIKDDVLTISGTGEMTHFSYIPNSNMGTTAPWYQYRDSYSSVKVESGITSIGMLAFHGCGIKSVDLPDTLTYIGMDAFTHELTMNKLVLPDSLKVVEKDAFSYSGIKSIVTGSSLETLKERAFRACDSLVAITFTDAIRSIGTDCFSSCRNLKTVIIPDDSLEYIGPGAFASCKSLSEFTVNKGLKTIGENAFYQCLNLKTVYNHSDLPIEAGQKKINGVVPYGYIGYYASEILA